MRPEHRLVLEMAHAQPHHGEPPKWAAGVIAIRMRQLRKRMHSQLVSAVIDTTIRIKLLRCSWIIIVTTILMISLLLSVPPLGLKCGWDKKSSVSKKRTSPWRFRIANDDIIYNASQVITLITNVTQSSDGLFAHGILNTEVSALLVFKHLKSGLITGEELATGARTSNGCDRGQPSLHALASTLKLESIVAPSFKVCFKLPFAQNVIKGRDARSLYRALGFRSASHIPPGYLIDVIVYPNERSIKSPPALFKVLKAPAIEPYEWRARFPSVKDCLRGKTNATVTGAYSEELDRACRTVADGLMVLAVAGCALPATSDILVDAQASTNTGLGNSFEKQSLSENYPNYMFRFGLPNDCFDQSTGSYMVSVELWKAYVEAVCPDITKSIDRLHALSVVQWGVAHRAAHMASWMEANTLLREACRTVA